MIHKIKLEETKTLYIIFENMLKTEKEKFTSAV